MQMHSVCTVALMFTDSQTQSPNRDHFYKLLMTIPSTHPILWVVLFLSLTHTYIHTYWFLSGLTKHSGGQDSVWIGWTEVAGGYGGFGGPPAEAQPPNDWKHLHQKPSRIETERKQGKWRKEIKFVLSTFWGCVTIIITAVNSGYLTHTGGSIDAVSLTFKHQISLSHFQYTLAICRTFVREENVPIVCCFTWAQLPTHLCFTVSENERTAPAVAVWWQWRTSVFAPRAAVVRDWWAETTIQYPECLKCETAHSRGCFCAWGKFGLQSRQQQSFTDNSTKVW